MSLDIFLSKKVTQEINVFDVNITHNLTKMADAAGLYEVMWRPEELNIKFAEGAISFLQQGIEKLKSNPNKFKKYEPSNGWGTYEGLLKAATEYLAACTEHPDAEIIVSR